MPEVATCTGQQVGERRATDPLKRSATGGHLRRRYTTEGRRARMSSAKGIAHLSGITWHHPGLHISWSGIEVVLKKHPESAASDRDFALAAAIGHRAAWRPPHHDALEGASLDGQWRCHVDD